MGHKVYGEINWITLARGLLQEMSLIKANQSVRQTPGSILLAVSFPSSCFPSPLPFPLSFSLPVSSSSHFHSLTHWRIEGQNNQNCIFSLSLSPPGPRRTSPYSNGSRAIDGSWTVKEISRILSFLSFPGALNGNNNCCCHAQGLNWQKEGEGEEEEEEEEEEGGWKGRKEGKKRKRESFVLGKREEGQSTSAQWSRVRWPMKGNTIQTLPWSLFLISRKDIEKDTEEQQQQLYTQLYLFCSRKQHQQML